MVITAIEFLIGFSSGLLISGAVFAFIAVVGIAPRIARRTGTERRVRLYEEAIIIGGILGCGTLLFDYKLPLGVVFEVVIGLWYGAFVGASAICLAEILNVIPVLCRRTGLKRGLNVFVCGIAAGKLAGALIYFLVPGFN